MKIPHRILATGAVVAVAAMALAACSGGASSTTPSPSSSGEISGTVTGIFDAQYKDAVEPIVTVAW